MAPSTDSFQGLNVALLSPPAGLQPDFVHPQSRASLLIGLSSTFLALAITLVTIRVYTKLYVIRKWSGDDCFCVIGLLGSITYVICCLTTLSAGVGVHGWDVLFSRLLSSRFFKLSYVTEVIIAPVQLAVKLSLLLFYLQLFHIDRKLRYLIYFGTIFTSLFYIACMLVQVILCTPRDGQDWVQTFVSGRVAQTIPLGVAQSAINALCDLYILCVPIQGVWQLQLPLRKKAGISMIFLSGFFAFLASILNLVNRLKLNRSGDITWDILPIFAVTIVEVNIGIMCGCMPFLAKFFRYHNALFTFFRSLIEVILKSFNHVMNIFTRRTSSQRFEGSLELIQSKSSPTQRKEHLLTLGTSFKRAQGLSIGHFSTANLESSQK